MGELATTDMLGIGGIGQVLLRELAQVIREGQRGIVEGGVRLGGKRKERDRPSGLARCGLRRLFEHDVRVRSADPQRGHSCATRPVNALPFR
jgi:hypothetical protein